MPNLDETDKNLEKIDDESDNDDTDSDDSDAPKQSDNDDTDSDDDVDYWIEYHKYEQEQAAKRERFEQVLASRRKKRTRTE